jgi:hypothetical protein
MNTFRFARIPSHSSVVAGVTTLVSAWFLVAAGAIMVDPGTDSIRVDPPREELRQAAAIPDIPEAAREKIVVTARRSARV